MNPTTRARSGWPGWSVFPRSPVGKLPFGHVASTGEAPGLKAGLTPRPPGVLVGTVSVTPQLFLIICRMVSLKMEPPRGIVRRNAGDRT